MHTVETVLIFVGGPVAVIAIVTGAVYLGSFRGNRRYRPGRPFEFAPVWFLASPQGSGSEAAGDGQPDPGGRAWPPSEPAQRAGTGGASDRW